MKLVFWLIPQTRSADMWLLRQRSVCVYVCVFVCDLKLEMLNVQETTETLDSSATQ